MFALTWKWGWGRTTIKHCQQFALISMLCLNDWWHVSRIIFAAVFISMGHWLDLSDLSDLLPFRTLVAPLYVPSDPSTVPSTVPSSPAATGIQEHAPVPSVPSTFPSTPAATGIQEKATVPPTLASTTIAMVLPPGLGLVFQPVLDGC